MVAKTRRECCFIETQIVIEYVAPDQSAQDATEIHRFTPGPGMQIPTENQVVTLPVKSPGGFEAHQKDFRVVRVRHAFSGFVPNMTGQIVHIVVADLEE